MRKMFGGNWFLCKYSPNSISECDLSWLSFQTNVDLLYTNLNTITVPYWEFSVELNSGSRKGTLIDHHTQERTHFSGMLRSY